jgi:hypothetical protein
MLSRYAYWIFLGVIFTTLVVVPATWASDGEVVESYIHEAYTLRGEVLSHLSSSEAAVARLATTVEGECPHAGAGAPDGRMSAAVTTEVIGTVEATFLDADRSAILTFARSVHRLHWQNRKLTRAANSYAISLKLLVTNTPPNLCSSVRAWAASTFRALPTQAQHYVDLVKMIERAPSRLAPSLLAPYERSASVPAMTALERLERRVEARHLKAGVAAVFKILGAVGIPL